MNNQAGIKFPTQEEIENKSVELADSEFAEPGLPHDLERTATRMAVWMRSEILRLNPSEVKTKEAKAFVPIDVKDRLPEKTGVVYMVIRKKYGTTNSFYDKSKNWFQSGRADWNLYPLNDVTHWLEEQTLQFHPPIAKEEIEKLAEDDTIEKHNTTDIKTSPYYKGFISGFTSHQSQGGFTESDMIGFAEWLLDNKIDENELQLYLKEKK